LLLALQTISISSAHAGIISSVQMFGPQAGTGTGLGTVSVAAFFTSNTNNDNQVGGGPNDNNITVPVKRFDNIGYIDIVFNVSPTSGTTEYKFFEAVDNNTFIDWSSYRLELGFGTGAGFNNINGFQDGLDFDFNTFDTPPTSSAFTTIAPFEDFMIFTNGLQKTGSETYSFRIDVPDLPQGRTSFTLRQSPVPVPEPGVFVVATIVGCGLMLRRRLF
jgi:hypothetical protein